MATTRFSSPIPSSTYVLVGDQIHEKPIPLKADARNLTVKLANRQASGAVAGGTFVTDVAVYASDGQGRAAGTPQGYWPNVVIPSDGTFWTAPTITDPILGPDGMIVVVYKLTLGLTSGLADLGLNVGHYGWVSATPGDTVFPAPPLINLLVLSNQSLQVVADYETDRPRIVELGDSIAYAANATSGFLHAALNQVAVADDLAVEILGAGSATLAMLAAPATFPVLWDGLIDSSVEALIIETGLSSLAIPNLPGMEADIATIVAYARSLGVKRVYLRTISPNQIFPGSEGIRITYNSFLRANSVGADGIYDAAAAAPPGLADPALLSTLLPAYAATDMTHLSAAGQTAEAVNWSGIFFFLSLAAEYSSTVWPPLYYPAYPLPPGWPSATPQLVPYTPPSSVQAPEFEPGPAPPTVLPAPTVESFNFQPPAPEPNETTYVDPNTTQSQIDALFRIVRS